MPYSPAHKPKTRERILASAAQLFSAKGFEQVSIDQIMAEAGLTRGAFYNHFQDKSELYAHAIRYAAHERFTLHKAAWKARPSLQTLIAGYISQEHIDPTSLPCPLAFLVTDVSQHDSRVRETYTEIFQGFVANLANLTTNQTRERQVSLAAATLMIGAVAIGRTLADQTTVEELLQACQQISLELLQSAKP